jgi:NAD(P)-dependent dehydrogenase (short-subunit alcohol dehydrogenase family)
MRDMIGDPNFSKLMLGEIISVDFEPQLRGVRAAYKSVTLSPTHLWPPYFFIFNCTNQYFKMEGTVLITGANGSLALDFVDQLLASYPTVALVGTVRNVSNEDPNTAKLNNILSKYPGRNVQVERLDLNSLDNVRQFADSLADRVATGSLPRISALVCNAFTWSLSGAAKYSTDGFESSFQVTYLSHYLLVLKLLGSMDAEKGRIVMLGSTAHNAELPNPLTKLKACFPDDIEELVHAPEHPPEQNHDRGFQRYGTAKLMIVFFMNDLNRRLQKVRDICCPSHLSS